MEERNGYQLNVLNGTQHFSMSQVKVKGVFSVHLLEHVIMMAYPFFDKSGYLATAYAMVATVFFLMGTLFRPLGQVYIIHKLALCDPKQ